MAVFSTIAKAVGGAVVGKIFGGGGGGGSAGPSESPTTTLANMKSLTAQKPNPVDTSKTTIKAAKQAPVHDFMSYRPKQRDIDPWQATKDWYKDLGGEDELEIEELAL